MKVEDIFKRLSLGPLSNLSLSNNGDGTIRDSDQDKIISYMNDSLLVLYSRFKLLERSAYIMQKMEITNYHMDSRFAKNNPDRPAENFPYILDLPAEPFSDDCITILSVNNEYGTAVPLNDSSHVFSMFTPYPNVLQVPYPQDGRPLDVIYQAAHPKLQYGVLNAEVNVPVSLVPAFISHITYLVYMNMGTQEATIKGQEHLTSYERICVQIEQTGQASTASIRNDTKFDQRGFV